MTAATRVRTGKTVVTRYDEEELSLSAVEVLPSLLQVRATLDKGWCLQYSRDMSRGDSFPPVLVFRTPDGRLLLSDGFHRVEAARSLGLTSVRAQVRAGTAEDALLAAVEANTAAFHRGRPFDPSDRVHAAELMIRNEQFRAWSDTEIGRRCGTGSFTVRRLRLRLRDHAGVPIPSRVATFTNGKQNGKTSPYWRFKGVSGTLPSVSRMGRGSFAARMNGKDVYLGKDPDAAQARLAALVGRQEWSKSMMRDPFLFAEALMRRGINVTTRGYSVLGGLGVADAVLFVVPDDSARAVLEAVGRAALQRRQTPGIGRVVLAGFFGSNPNLVGLIALATRPPDPIEFMTPDEVVAAFATK